VTPSRGDILSVHDPFHGQHQLQPSAMPPPSTASPNAPANPIISHPPIPKLDKSRLEKLGASGAYDAITSWRKNASPRRALLAVNTNSTYTSTSTQSTSRPSVNARLSVPRAPLLPDVFACPEDTSTSIRKPFIFTSTSKRSREVENVPPESLKRVKAEDGGKSKGDGRVLTGRRSVEEEVWRAKWRRVFPGLTFHFESGAEEGQGKILKQRVLKMNAVSVSTKSELTIRRKSIHSSREG
jgi:hypothetical protein